MQTNDTITLDGIKYVVVSIANYQHNGQCRKQITLRRPKGKRTYVVYHYENGAFSHVI